MKKLLFVFATVAMTAAASGCIDAEALMDDIQEGAESWQEEWEDEHDDHDWEDERDEDCPEEDEDDHGASAAAGHDHDADDEETVDLDNAFTDADPRFHNIVSGHEDSKRTISVQLGDDELRVGLAHEFEGNVDIRLRNPLGITVAREEFAGSKSMIEDEWFSTEDPLFGDWTLEIDVHGEGGYTVGFYLDA